MITFETVEAKLENTCKGQVFRFVTNNYVSNDTIVFSRKLRLLQRRSCKGCGNCGNVIDDINEGISLDCGPDVVIPDSIMNGDVVVLDFIIDRRDWETGYVDDWHYVARKID